jgi:hypothetical protein
MVVILVLVIVVRILVVVVATAPNWLLPPAFFGHDAPVIYPSVAPSVPGQYNQYQQNYQSMFDKKVPDSIDFREKVVDGPLPGNMEDLVQRHLRERDEELQRYAPQPFFGGQLPAKEPSNRLTIDPSPENVKLAVEEIAPPPIYRNEPEKKVGSVDHTVKWLDNENSDKIRSLEQEVAILKNQVLQMSDKISLLINANKDIFDFSAQRLRMNNATIRGGFLFDPSST